MLTYIYEYTHTYTCILTYLLYNLIQHLDSFHSRFYLFSALKCVFSLFPSSSLPSSSSLSLSLFSPLSLFCLVLGVFKFAFQHNPKLHYGRSHLIYFLDWESITVVEHFVIQNDVFLNLILGSQGGLTFLLIQFKYHSIEIVIWLYFMQKASLSLSDCNRKCKKCI